MAPFIPSFFRQLVLKYRPYPSQALAPLLTIPSSSPGFRIQNAARAPLLLSAAAAAAAVLASSLPREISFS